MIEPDIKPEERFYDCYHMGYGVTEAEELRQWIVAECLLTHRCDDCPGELLSGEHCPTLELTLARLDRLAELGGQHVFQS